ncbi:unnamed protein product [Menidia menidia]|uniref:(Atlantic silverside) hypothetical protein n=1 Tax=Menidia menidia TaxID=238744 RepID=A0A8S4BSW6_9TELE|nr:unnamed protein product [Menidia menidia]
MLQGGFFKVPTQLLELSLTLLVHLNLSGCCSSSFLKSFTDLLKFPGEFLDLLLKLSTKRLFILNLAEKLADFKIHNGFLGQFQISFKFPFGSLEFLELLLATLHGEVLSLIQTMLEVLDCDLQVLLHPLQTYISDSLFGFLFGISSFLNSIIHLTLNLDKSCSQLLNLSQHQTISALHHGNLLLHVFLSSESIIKPYKTHLELSLDIPQLFLGLSSLPVGMTQLNLHLIQVSLHLLLDSQSIIPAPDLSIKSALHGVNHPLAVSLDLLHFFIFLCQLPVNFTFDLVELKLNTENLGLLLIQSLFIGVLHLEQLSAERTGLLLGSFQLCLALLILLFPLGQDLHLQRSEIDLIKVPLLLVQVGSQSISSLHINHEVLHLPLQPLLGLLQRSTLGVDRLNGFLSILKALGNALNSISLIFASPLSNLTVGLGHSSLQLSLCLLLLLKLLSEQITVMAG